MKRKVNPVLFVAVALLLSACVTQPAQQTDPAETTVSVPTTEYAPETSETEPVHSDLYLPDYTREQITEYFNEVVLHMEYSDGTGDTGVVQKWLAPVYYRLYGERTDEDMTVLEDLFEQLNRIPGFPGIYAAEEGSQENLSIFFGQKDMVDDRFSEILNGEDAWGVTQFWYYTDTNELHTAQIGYRADIDQTTRSTILVEEIVNALGISDTVLRRDSVVYQWSNENMVLSDVDLVILKLLYDPAIQPGMDAQACARVIEQLYR